MGIFRTYLALLVIGIHTGNWLFASAPFGGDGHVPVLGFFTISGFYMALVLDRKYMTYAGGIADFYVNRALRIYPAYLVILAVSIGLAELTGTTSIDGWSAPVAKVLADLPTLTPLSDLLLATANLTTFGTNALVETGFLPSGIWSSEVGAEGFIAAKYFLLFPPAWTLGIELTFYLFAPLLMSARRVLPVVIVLFYFYAIYLNRLPVPHTYTAMPIMPGSAFGHLAVVIDSVLSPALLYCFCGMAAYFVYKHMPNSLRDPWIGRCLLILLLVYGAASNWLPFSTDRVISWFQILTWVAIPFMFVAFRRSRIDYIIGNFSYALYVSHFAAYKLLEYVAGEAVHKMSLYYPTLFAFAFVIVFLIEQPIDRLRERRVAIRRRAVPALANA